MYKKKISHRFISGYIYGLPTLRKFNVVMLHFVIFVDDKSKGREFLLYDTQVHQIYPHNGSQKSREFNSRMAFL